jgi:hypothetical protein
MTKTFIGLNGNSWWYNELQNLPEREYEQAWMEINLREFMDNLNEQDKE